MEFKTTLCNICACGNCMQNQNCNNVLDILNERQDHIANAGYVKLSADIYDCITWMRLYAQEKNDNVLDQNVARYAAAFDATMMEHEDLSRRNNSLENIIDMMTIDNRHVRILNEEGEELAGNLRQELLAEFDEDLKMFVMEKTEARITKYCPNGVTALISFTPEFVEVLLEAGVVYSEMNYCRYRMRNTYCI